MSGPVAFVLGGGGLLGAHEVGMLQALLEAGIVPDLVVGTSVGALNGVVIAAEPTPVAQEVSFEPEALPSCPKCGGKVWDNRATKRNPKAPDFKCRDRTCDGVIWPPKGNAARPAAPPAPAEERGLELDTAPLGSAMDEIPF